MSFHDKKKLCIVLIAVLIILAVLPLRKAEKEQIEGEYITTKEVEALTLLLQTVSTPKEESEVDAGQSSESKEIFDAAQQLFASWPDETLSYRQFYEWSMVLGEEKDLSEKYARDHFFLKKDLYDFFEDLLVRFDPEGKVQKRELLLLGCGDQVKDIEGKPIADGLVFSDDGLWTVYLPDIGRLIGKKAACLTYDDGLWGVLETEEEASLSNAWLLEAKEDFVFFFYGNHEVRMEGSRELAGGREQVVDLFFQKGKMDRITAKTDRINGEVLKLTEDEVEIKGRGTFALDENVQFYQLYDSLQTVGRNSVKLGYDFADFVLDEGRVQAGLLAKDEKMEHIRVLLKTGGFEGYYHDVVELVSDVELRLTFGEREVRIPAGESIRLSSDHEYFQSGRIFLEPLALTGKTSFLHLKRSQQGQGYRGSFELEKRQEGILIINKVLLEEYLYSVVPSEMPAGFPIEALKAQAICARTYAYSRMETPALGEYGAHLDDSTSFQVYNNIQENTSTTKAVKETRGLLLYYGDELAQTYYYSTSGGFGANESIWNKGADNQLPYLEAKEMTIEAESVDSEDLQKEEGFREYMDRVHPSHFESEESWYRWTYHLNNTDRIAENLYSRQKSYPNDILVSVKEGEFFSGEIPNPLTLVDVEVRKRGAGGAVEELLFTAKEGRVLVTGELNIRSVLADKESEVYLQDGKTYACGSLLPSSFYYLITRRQEDILSKVEIVGGGFGHGLGMSQNGAKNLAKTGYNHEDILLFYYSGCQILQP